MARKSIEKVYNNVFTVGRMSLETLVVNGSKNSENMRLDSLYYNTFQSEKYADVDQLDNLKINNQSYLCLIYRGYNEENKFESEEVWIGPKYLENFKDFLVDAYEQLSSESDKIYGKSSVNPEYEELIIQTGYEEDGGGYGDIDGLGHVVYVYPQVCFIEEEAKKSYPGVVLVIENDKGEQYAQEMSLNTFRRMAMTVRDYNLLQDSRATMIEGMLYQLLSSGGGSISSPGKKNLSRPLKSRNSVVKPLQKRKPLSEVIAEDNDDDDVEEDIEVEETPAPKKKITKKKTPAKKTNKIALNDILNESEGMELNLDDEEGEEY
mgnify:CR=1 FL=1